MTEPFDWVPDWVPGASSYLEYLRMHLFPSLSSSFSTLKWDIMLLGAIIRSISNDSRRKFFESNKWDIYQDFIDSVLLKLVELEFDPPPLVLKEVKNWIEALQQNLTVKYMPAVKQILHLQLEIQFDNPDLMYASEAKIFINDLERVIEKAVQFIFYRQATIAFQNLKSFQKVINHIEELCFTEDDGQCRRHISYLRHVVDNTALLIYMFYTEPETNHKIKLTELFQMTKLTNPEVRDIYKEALMKSGPSDYRESWTHKKMINFMDHLLLFVKAQIRCADPTLQNQLETLYGYLMLVDHIVRPEQLVYSDRVFQLVTKSRTTVGSFSFTGDDEGETGMEKNNALLEELEERIILMKEEVVVGSLIDHLLYYLNKQISRCQVSSAVCQLEQLHEYMTVVKHIVSHPPLTYMLKRIDSFYNLIARLAISIILFSTIEEGEGGGAVEKKLTRPPNSDVADLIEQYKKTMADVKLRLKNVVALHPNIEYGKPSINQYIDDLETFQSNLLDSNEQAIKSVQILRSYQHSSNSIASWSSNVAETTFHLQTVADHTALVLYLCWVEPEMDYQTKLIDLDKMTKLINPEVSGIYLNALESFLHNRYSTWRKAAWIIGQLIIYVEELMRHCQARSVSRLLRDQFENIHEYMTLIKVMVSLNDISERLSIECMPSKMEAFFKVVRMCKTAFELFSVENRIGVVGDLEESSRLMKKKLAEDDFVAGPFRYSMEKMKHYANSASLNGQWKKLHKHMEFVKGIVWNPPLQYTLDRMTTFHKLVFKVAVAVGSFSATSGEKMVEVLADLEEQINLMDAEVIKENLFEFPLVGELFSMDKFLENLEELMRSKADVIAPMKHQLEAIYPEPLKSLRSYLQNVKDNGKDSSDQVKVLQRRITQVVFDAEFIIQSLLVGVNLAGYHLRKLSALVKEIQHISTQVQDVVVIQTSFQVSTQNCEEKTCKGDSLQGSTPEITDDVVGFAEESKAILDELFSSSANRDIVSIIGMPGLGKTTLAKKLYNDPVVKDEFEVRAWCYVSQSFQRKELLLQILRSITDIDEDQLKTKSDEDIALLVYQRLCDHHYLIVLDDLWDTEAWDALKNSFPDDNMHSRILITSREHSVGEALKQVTPESYVHDLREFTVEESNMLLKQKLFGKDDFPDQLVKAGWMIAENCFGLPLAVVLAAGILAGKGKNASQWMEFGHSLNTQILNDPQNQCKKLIQLSYDRLPDHLKSCFLYFGTFKEDKNISARKLYRLWIAEGFIRDTNSTKLEDIASHYLIDLIGRSLVIVSKTASRPGVKSCYVHDLLRDFCIEKGRKQNFLNVVHGYDNLFTHQIGGFDYGDDPEHSEDPSKITHQEYRLSIHSKRKKFIMAKPSGPNARTLLFHALGDMHPNYIYDASFISKCFKLVSVLDLASINIRGGSLTGICLLLHLRYLAVRGIIESIPSSIANLTKLETFLLIGSMITVVSVPNEIWSLLRLRHLHIDGQTSFDMCHEPCVNYSLLPGALESFSTPTISYGDDMEKMLQRFQNLGKLKCAFLDSWDIHDKCNRFPVLESLLELVSLKVFYTSKRFHQFPRNPCKFSFPHNLKKLTLSEFGLPWSEISSIGKLQNLEVLKLLSRAFVGDIWHLGEGDFINLKFLKLDSLDIIELSAATRKTLPSIQRLVFTKCKKLKEISSIFGSSTTLKMIQVYWCSNSAAKSARNIYNQQLDCQNETFKVDINP